MKISMAICAVALLLGQSALADQYSDAANCEAYARKVEREQGRVLGGAARGAARGALVGQIIGRDKDARRRGAKLEAIAGGARRARAKDRAYEEAFARCMSEIQSDREQAEEKSDD